MVSKILHITCMVLLAVLAIMMLVNAFSALNLDYEKTAFTITGMYQDASSGDKYSAYLQGMRDGEAFYPENAYLTNDTNLRPGDTIELWYSPSDNQINPGYMGRIVTNFISAAACIACIIFTFPRKEHPNTKQTAKNKKKKK